MQCYNCKKTIPDGAKCCLHCEADQSNAPDLSQEEMEAAVALLEQAMPGTLDELRSMANQCSTAEEFANALFVGDCPSCKSNEVGTFEEVVGVENPTVARCFSCSHIWCTECYQPLKDPKTDCGHWTVCDICGKEDCEFLGASHECPKVAAWIEEQQGGDSDAPPKSNSHEQLN